MSEHEQIQARICPKCHDDHASGYGCEQNLIADHPFQQATWQDAWSDLCGYRGEFGDWPCGFSADEHVTRPEGATGEVTPNESR